MFECSKCGFQYPKWQGRCTECGNWGLVEVEEISKIPTGTKSNINTKSKASELIDLSEVSSLDAKRIKTNISEVDLVLGGGIVPGSLVLLAGQPGIGKSTIVMQIASKIKEDFILYVSGEETKEQIKNRLDRLNCDAKNIKFSGDIVVENIIATIEKHSPKLVIIDSIQTIYSNEIENSLGSTNQIKACTAKILEVSKRLNIPVIIIGHITKDGTIGGPKTLEHMVDVVLYFEAQKYKNFRILRSVKNRFGSTSEVGMFQMNENGLSEVVNPMEVFMDKENQEKGNIVTCIQEGTRPFLIEVQALISKTAFGYPKRTTSGFSMNRLEVIIAVLTKKLGLELFNFDIYINVVGGVNPKDTGIDLAVSSAIISAYLNKEIANNICIFGEIGLSGEIRSVTNMEARIKEISKMGFSKIIIPKTRLNKDSKDDRIIEIRNVKELLEILRKA